HHCVFGLARSCTDGYAFVFHVEKDGAHATIHIDDAGDIVEARGPFNRHSPAVTWGSNVLRHWALALWVKRFPKEQLAWLCANVEAPPGTKPLRNVRAIVEAYATLDAAAPPNRLALRDWFVCATHAATKGACVLAQSIGPDACVYALDQTGAL